jgi:membrane associated rhomboid family serine protease
MAFTNTPVSRLLLISLISGSILASLLDVKHYFYISLHVHIWRYQQFWRLLTYQLCYANSAEVLFAAITLYHLRVVERMWGSRKYAVGGFFWFCSCFCSCFCFPCQVCFGLALIRGSPDSLSWLYPT